jgi:hypothetical protein
VPRYCSAACRGDKHHPSSETDRWITDTFIRLLNSAPNRKQGVLCGTVQAEVFRADAAQSLAKSEDRIISEDLEGRGVPQSKVEGGGREGEGKKKAEQRERVRRVARRGVRWGFPSIVSLRDGQDTVQRAVEAVGVGGSKVKEDVSFLKGEWGLRWKD